MKDETANSCKYVAATPHYLESWGDYEFKGTLLFKSTDYKTSFDTNQFQDVILTYRIKQ